MTSDGRDVQRCSCAFDVRNISSNAPRSKLEGIIETRVRAAARGRHPRLPLDDRAALDDRAIRAEVADVDLEEAAAVGRDTGNWCRCGPTGWRAGMPSIDVDGLALQQTAELRAADEGSVGEPPPPPQLTTDRSARTATKIRLMRRRSAIRMQPCNIAVIRALSASGITSLPAGLRF